MFLETLIQLDIAVFIFFNHTCQNPIFDVLMPFITVKEHLAPAMFLVVGLLLWKGGRKGRILVGMLIAAIALSDQVTSHLIKPWVSRLRPCFVFEPLSSINALFGSKSSPSFPSAHASNAFAMASLFALTYPRSKAIALGAACLVAFSRVYVGVHYPMDIISGAIIGTLCGIWIKYTFDLVSGWPVEKQGSI
ncbi:MAG: phosphatase PAP2 family protein [candidate division KSB1 bacterium]|nr:phosphatase PAP2 family protein [candidate division KSB1 bacterium]